MKHKLDEILNIHNMHCAVAIDQNGNIVGKSDNIKTCLESSLASSLIGPYGSALDTFNSLEGMLLPQIQAQGDLFAFIDKPQDNVVIIIFGEGKQSAKENYLLSKEVSKTINSYAW